MRRTTGPVWDAWNFGGALVGDSRRSHGRVTVQADWWLRDSGPVCGARDPKKNPVRYYQSANGFAEVEVPNVKSIHITRTVDQDVAQAEIVIYNQRMVQAGPTDLGSPGYFTPNRGTAGNRWSHLPNEWADILVEDALLRSYEGWGGFLNGAPKPVDVCQAEGSLTRTGTWIVDEVLPNTDGTLTLKCRDAGKLLVEQMAYPPTIPSTFYPLDYSRWYYRVTSNPNEEYGANADPPESKVVVGIEAGPAVPDVQGGPSFSGYWLVADDGGVFTFGENYFYGSVVGIVGVQEHQIISMARTADGGGYWLLNFEGQVYAFGNAVWSGNGPTRPSIFMTIEADWGHGGYLMMDATGEVYTFGGAVYHGGSPPTSQPIVDMAMMPDGSGYWMLDLHGGVYSYGAAIYHGNALRSSGPGFTGIAATPTGQGYWLVDSVGHVYSFGDAIYYGGTSGLTLTDGITDITASPAGNGYWLVAGDGGVFTFGPPPSSQFDGSTSVHVYDQFGVDTATVTGLVLVDGSHLTFRLNANLADGLYRVQVVGVSGDVEWVWLAVNVDLPDPLPSGIVLSPQKVSATTAYTFTVTGRSPAALPSLRFYGSLPAPSGFVFPLDGNYRDLVDIVKDLLLFAGFWFYPLFDAAGQPEVYGNVESTGTYVNDRIARDVFDKKPLMDGITQMKEIVGYLFRVDEDGAIFFGSPNFWGPGNFLPDGSHTTFIPTLDERVGLIQLGMDRNDKALRSRIVIANEEPTQNITGTVSTTLIPASAAALRGIEKPAVLVEQVMTDPHEQSVMAQLIAVQLGFQQFVAQVDMIANPCICVDDQVWIMEERSEEMYVHYVRGVDSNHDLDTGEYRMTLTTHRMGTPGAWPVVRPT